VLAILPTFVIRAGSVSSFLQLFCSFCFLPNRCNQRLLVAFPTLLLFKKVIYPASDGPPSSWVQACSQTFRRHDFPFLQAQSKLRLIVTRTTPHCRVCALTKIGKMQSAGCWLCRKAQEARCERSTNSRLPPKIALSRLIWCLEKKFGLNQCNTVVQLEKSDRTSSMWMIKT